MRALPATVSFWDGVEVPMPTKPPFVTLKTFVPVEDATEKISCVLPSVPTTASFEVGIVLPIPTFPPLITLRTSLS